jgi:hypothetical protein
VPNEPACDVVADLSIRPVLSRGARIRQKTRLVLAKRLALRTNQERDSIGGTHGVSHGKKSLPKLLSVGGAFGASHLSHAARCIGETCGVSHPLLGTFCIGGAFGAPHTSKGYG